MYSANSPPNMAPSLTYYNKAGVTLISASTVLVKLTVETQLTNTLLSICGNLLEEIAGPGGKEPLLALSVH